MTRDTCSTCRWWDPIDGSDGNRGLCRVNPPAMPDGGGVIADWPQTFDNDRCRLHESEPPQPLRIRTRTP